MTGNDAVPEVSWLVCSHVADARLRAAISSCLSQTFVDFELVMVANGPNCDAVADAVRAWFIDERRLLVICTKVRHLTFSLSLGLHTARASLIARMDGDDLAYSDRLRVQVEYMRAHPQVAVLGTAYEVIDEQDQPRHQVHVPCSDNEIRRKLFRGNPICHPTVMMRRDVALAAGGYLGGPYAQDYDLWSRLALDKTCIFANLDVVCLGYRKSPAGNARRARGAYAAMAGAQFRNLAAGGGLRWGAAAVLSWIKACWRGR
jgi:glycosyltransferase involved in cell wall biosynthesis